MQLLLQDFVFMVIFNLFNKMLEVLNIPHDLSVRLHEL